MIKFFEWIKIKDKISISSLINIIGVIVAIAGYMALTIILLDVGDVELLNIDFSSMLKIIFMIFSLLFLLVSAISFIRDYSSFVL